MSPLAHHSCQTLFLAALLGASPPGALTAHASGATHILGAYTLMAPKGGSIVRVLTDSDRCPSIRLDGHDSEMRARAAPRTIAARISAFDGSTIPAAAFPLTVCEAPVARQVAHATVAGMAVPLPRAIIRRIVVIGDTGCRLKASAQSYQACNDAAAWPFARIARAAAAAHPDLVLHVGDYHYRESPCPEGNTGCAGSPWGYGWDVWRADFFAPAAPLLAAAPWAVVRGNHEECARAGVGWWLMLDPHPLVAGADCADAADAAGTFAGNHTAPYAVELGGRGRIILPSVSAVISGHIHLLQYAALAGHPPQIVAGMSGTQEDEPPAPADSRKAQTLPAGLIADDLATRYGHFGYAVLDRLPRGAWKLTAYDLDGTLVLKRIVPRRGS